VTSCRRSQPRPRAPAEPPSCVPSGRMQLLLGWTRRKATAPRGGPTWPSATTSFRP